MNIIDHREKLYLEREMHSYSPNEKKSTSPGKGSFIQEPAYSRLNLLANNRKSLTTDLPKNLQSETNSFKILKTSKLHEGLTKDSVTGKTSFNLV